MRITNVTLLPTRDIASIDPYCEMDTCVLTVDREVEGGKGVKCYLAFNSRVKMMKWLDAMNVHCLNKHRNRNAFRKALSTQEAVNNFVYCKLKYSNKNAMIVVKVYRLKRQRISVFNIFLQ